MNALLILGGLGKRRSPGEGEARGKLSRFGNYFIVGGDDAFESSEPLHGLPLSN